MTNVFRFGYLFREKNINSDTIITYRFKYANQVNRDIE